MSIRVVGVGIARDEPNMATMTVGIEADDPSLVAAQEEAGRRARAVLGVLRDSGIREVDMRTATFNVEPRIDPNTRELRGYTVQHALEVRTGDLAGMGALIDRVTAAGAARVGSIHFGSNDPAALIELARDQAMQNARAKAEQLAQGLGVGLGRPLLIEETDGGGGRPRDVSLRRGSAPSEGTPIQGGELVVRTTVRVVWAIEERQD